ncbi:hypothetical protein BCR43DRAFT_522473, partial [Syncephalastrum racemosum]
MSSFSAGGAATARQPAKIHVHRWTDNIHSKRTSEKNDAEALRSILQVFTALFWNARYDNQTIGAINDNRKDEALPIKHSVEPQHTQPRILELYVQEFAALTNVLQLNNKLSIVLSRSIMFDKESYMAISTHITELSGSRPNRELGIVALTNMCPRLPWGKAYPHGSHQPLPVIPLNDWTVVSRSELWSTYFHPALSVI